VDFIARRTKRNIPELPRLGGRAVRASPRRTFVEQRG